METAALMGRSMDVVQWVLGDVLDLMLMEERQLALEPRWTVLGALVDAALGAGRAAFERTSGATLSQHLPPAVADQLARTAVFVDPCRLRRALGAMLANASGITPQGESTRIRVKVTPRKEPPRGGSPAALAALEAGIPRTSRQQPPPRGKSSIDRGDHAPTVTSTVTRRSQNDPR